MNPVARFIDLVRDSPSYGRDRASLISGFTIGTAGLLLNSAVMVLALPLLLDPDDSGFLDLKENVGVGQLLALILLGGATMFATLLIPLRLTTVFTGPRLLRYFDQIVLSGISPLRFVIGKATSQNLYLGLVLFLLLPYFVFSLALGGVHLGFFLAGLFLVWLYCMALALVTLWASLYLNDQLAAALVIAAAAILAGLGLIPMPLQPFVMTPVPALVHPVLMSFPSLNGRVPESFLLVFLSCAGCMAAVITIAFSAISLGPLFGIIRENSTFGEVVRAGDSKRKRWIQFRLHIQRPSEIAFFYENRGDAFRRNEGIVRWGAVFCGLVALLGVWFLVYGLNTSKLLSALGGTPAPGWWVYEFHTVTLMTHGFGLTLGAFAFSHSCNSVYLRIPFVRGRTVEVSRLDTRAYVLFVFVGTTASIAASFLFEYFCALPNANTLFPDLMYGTRGRPVDYIRVAIEGSLVLTVAGMVVYGLHRFVCLITWLRSLTFVMVAFLYFMTVCLIPLFCGALFVEVSELRHIPLLSDWMPRLALISPMTVVLLLFNELGPRFPAELSTAPFYVGHAALFGLTMAAIRRRGRRLRESYLEPQAPKTD